ncbi:hypothetical protein WR25_16099 isoform A [Diploscapter pachys]|uniref:Histone-lysine N-methyltransferase n=1 Tax=Diploscapter pachys TaxID=2018661 RepID=A0A2A2JX94_9BILA|nr:hypothetical protein WR25_16099 isoform A [Diploscapter pachys]
MLDFEYISTSERGSGVAESEWNETLQGCECEGPCTSSTNCSCLLESKENYSEDGILFPRAGNSAPLLECHDECQCVEKGNCTNRVLQSGIQVRLKVVNMPNKGCGVIALEPVQKGQFVCEYAGEIIGPEEVLRRAELHKNDEHNYIFTIKERSQDNSITTYVDPRYKGNIARFVNHSCDPNLQVVSVRIGRTIPVVGLFAKRDISSNEELSYDYGESLDAENQQKPCHCGSENCRGFLPVSKMGRHSKIPKKNRKKLKSVDPYNLKAKLFKEKNANKTKNFAPADDQPMSRALKMLQKAKDEVVVDRKELRKRKKHRNRVLEEAGKMGIKKNPYETIDQFVKRVEQMAHFDIERHKFMAELGFAGRSEDEIKKDYKEIDDKAERAKEQKKREIKNKIETAKKRRLEEQKRRMEKAAKRKEQFGQVQQEEDQLENEHEDEMEIEKRERKDGDSEQSEDSEVEGNSEQEDNETEQQEMKQVKSQNL